MAGNSVDQCEVRFSPDGVAATLARGSTILEACSAAGIAIDAVCGGEGKCGRCKVRLKGEFLPGRQDSLSRAEVDAGIVLACEATVEGSLEVEILPRSRIRKHQILVRSVEREVPELSPWLWKTFLEMPKATLFDNTADLERLIRAMSDKELTMPIETLRRLPRIAREGDWKVTTTISRLEPPPEIVRLEAGDQRGRLLGLAVDIGTTTVVGQLVNLLTGEVLATASEYNRQISKGEDIIARMMFSEDEGVEELTALAQRTVNSVIADLLKTASKKLGELTAFDIVGASVSGNTVMTHFFVGLDTRYIRLEPYVPVTHHMPPRSGHDLGMDMHPSGRVLL
ncbi:MAG: 2Fe-2S iron-sulfur cluster-binding protein, partial [Thermoplasmata archaeon]|nr:2Fe-2S iron-sulfur cluster-binding protein [Thermoplasmata archaeon]